MDLVVLIIPSGAGDLAEPAPGGEALAPEARFARLEESLEQIRASLAGLAGERGAALAGPEKKKHTGTRALPGLDAGVLATARDAGITEEQLQRLSGLLVKPNRMEERSRSARPAGRRRTALSETEEDPEEEEEPELLPDNVTGEGKEPVEQAVLQLTKLITKMAEKDNKKKSGLEEILDRVDTGGNADGSGGGTSSGRTKAAAYKRIRAALEKHPEWIYRSVEGLMEEDFQQIRNAPGSSSRTVSSRAWLEHRSKLLHYPSTIRTGWIISGVHDCLKEGRVAEARARCALALGSDRSEQFRLRKLEPIPRTSTRTSSTLPCIPGAPKPGLARTSHHQDHRRSGARASNVEAQGEGQLSRVSSTPGWCTEEQRRRSPSRRRSRCAKERTKAETQAESKGSRADRRVCAPRRLSEKVESQVPDKPLKVPGAAASTMHAGIWDLAFSALLRARASFSSFAHSILAGRAPAQRAPKEQVWPMPLPFPEVHCRARSRQKVGASLKLGINYVVLVLNWLHLGEQLCDVAALKLGTKLNLAQWQVVRRISPLVSTCNEQGAVASADMGRSAAKVESIEAELRRLEEAACTVKLAEEAYFKRRDEQSRFGFSEAPGERRRHRACCQGH